MLGWVKQECIAMKQKGWYGALFIYCSMGDLISLVLLDQCTSNGFMLLFINSKSGTYFGRLTVYESSFHLEMYTQWFFCNFPF